MPLLNGTLIQEALGRADMPVRVAAEDAGITYDALHNIVSGRSSASVEVGYRLARNLGIRPDLLSPDLLPDPRCARTARQRRQVTGRRRSEVADEIGITRGRLSGIEQGNGRPPGADTVWRLAKSLGCRPRDIAPPGTPPWTLDELAAADADADPGRVPAAVA